MKNSNNINLIAELKAHLDSMTSEEIEKKWDELKEYNFGPTVEEYLKWNDSCDAQTIADDSNYLTCGDKHYCPNCYSVNDNDNYITKDGYIYDGNTHKLLSK